MISDRERWQQARHLFDQLVEMDHGVRRARLEEIGRQDPPLRDAVERLLVADGEASTALHDYSFGSADDTVDGGTPDQQFVSHDAPAATNSRDPLGVIGRTVSHFRVTEYLAAGGMGVVYVAEDQQLGRTVALKFPLPHQHLGRAVTERFVNEARSAAALDHPNLCTVYEIGEGEHGVFLAMPLYPGETLKDHLDARSSLPPAEALDILVQVTSGLAAAHAAGIVHRDLKPGNLMLLPDGSVKVLDFGLAKILDVDLTGSRVTLGTIGYVAPEQIRGGAVDARTDLWAIGAMLYEMLTGARPFRGDHEMAVMHAVLEDEPTPPSSVNGQIPATFDELVLTLLQKEPADRYQSADALLEDLVALRRGEPVRRPTRFWNRARRRRLRRALMPAAAVALLTITGLAWQISLRTADRRSMPVEARVAASLVWNGDTVEVQNGAELAAALVPANTGRRVRLRAGEYEVDRPLIVPDGMTLEGAGVMHFDDGGLPVGFTEETRSSLRMTASTGGNMLTLGNGVTVRNVEVVDLAGRSGNVLAVESRRPGDSISAIVEEIVIRNPNPLVIGAGGALGRGIYVVTRNPNMGADPAAHEAALLSLQVLRSVLRAPNGGGGLFVFNFAANSRIAVDVSGSVISGSNEANGGVSRPDVVHDSQVRITSRGNRYRNEWEDPCTSPLLGWNLTGGSGAPIPIPLPVTTRNRLDFSSLDDRIEAFTLGLLATGSRRFFAAPLNAAPSDNHIDLQLIGTTFQTPTCSGGGAFENTAGIAVVGDRDIADLRLIGAWVERESIDAGSRNTVRAEIRGVTGSGKRENRYAHASGSIGPSPAQSAGGGNRLELVGYATDFSRLNRSIDPAPAAEFFTNAPSTRADVTREPLSATKPRKGEEPSPRRTP